MHHKSTTNKGCFNGLPINTGNGRFFCFHIILQRLYDSMWWMTGKHCRVLAIRFDLHFPVDYKSKGENVEIQHFFKIMRDNARNLSKRKGAKIDLHYVWVKEQKSSKHPHYHCIVFVNGSVVRDYRRFLGKVIKVWGRVLDRDAKNYVWPCDRNQKGMAVENGVILERPPRKASVCTLIDSTISFNSAIDHLFYRASYLAKTNQKQDASPDSHRFGASQLR
ncbi:YagK/YfjJ domain-containing protein [Pseudodesulfovibrio nedwellii]|uniref:YagK/YfjJ domain-containing protein n=1 Tax=Pseudodesulfovibrio nedwellii TaxID=2973072 RepID=UPI0024904675|nr:inovirus-type Gp2 protein [Pseudodesulfovibrio nedwellii]